MITRYFFVQIQSSNVTEGVSLGDRKRLTPGHKTESFRAGGMDVYHNSKIFMEDWRNFCKLLNWMSTRITRTRIHMSILNSWFSFILWFFVCALTNTHAVLDPIFILLSSGYKMRLFQAKLILQITFCTS